MPEEKTKELSVDQKIERMGKAMMKLEGRVDRLTKTMAEYINWMKSADRMIEATGRIVERLHKKVGS